MPKDAEILKDDHGKKRKKRWDERGPKVKAERTEKEPKKEKTAGKITIKLSLHPKILKFIYGFFKCSSVFATLP